MTKENFKEWLEDNGHVISKDAPFYKVISTKYQKKPLNFALLLELSLDSFLSDNPVENFFVDEEFVYAPEFKEVYTIKPRVKPDRLVDLLANKYHLEYKIDSPECGYNLSLLRKRISRNLTNLKSLLDCAKANPGIGKLEYTCDLVKDALKKEEDLNYIKSL